MAIQTEETPPRRYHDTVAEVELSHIIGPAVLSESGGLMPIRQFLGREAAFQPEELQAMGDAFSAALNRLGLVDREDPMVEMVARRIVRAAIAGERNVSTLTEVGTNGRD